MKDETPSEIKLGGITYKVLINDASNVEEKQTVNTTDTPTTTEVPATKAPTGKPTATSTATPVPVQTNSEGGTFEDFVERLYTVALNRASEPEGKAFWCEHVGNGDLTGAACANEFLLSKEFKDRNLNDEEFLKVLYKTFFDRDAAKRGVIPLLIVLSTPKSGVMSVHHMV